MRGPSKLKQNELVSAIVQEIKSCNRPAAEAAKVVAEKLREIAPLIPGTNAEIADFAPFGTRGADRKLARRIGPHLAEVLKAIAGAPEGSRYALFVTAFFQGSIRPEQLVEEGRGDQMGDWAERLIFDMTALNKGCQLLLQQPVGDYHESEYCKHLAVGAAGGIWQELSTEPPTSSSPASPVRVIASLIYRRITGQTNVDLAAYCNQRVAEWVSFIFAKKAIDK